MLIIKFPDQNATACVSSDVVAVEPETLFPHND